MFLPLCAFLQSRNGMQMHIYANLTFFTSERSSIFTHDEFPPQAKNYSFGCVFTQSPLIRLWSSDSTCGLLKSFVARHLNSMNSEYLYILGHADVTAMLRHAAALTSSNCRKTFSSKHTPERRLPRCRTQSTPRFCHQADGKLIRLPRNSIGPRTQGSL